MYKAKTLQPPGSEDLVEAAKIIAAAKRPTILCGLGAAQGKAEKQVPPLLPRAELHANAQTEGLLRLQKRYCNGSF
jgi:thiamine pyrophosphate-dependent acetolactate synthase large subunit-like protein